MDRIIHFLSTSRTALILLLATLLTATAAQTAWASSFSGGSGTQADPFKISSSADLVQLATDINNSTSRLYEDQYFVQTGNINMSGINFVPIGINDNNNHRFRGRYNGQNYTISNLTVNGSYEYTGLFGYIYNAEIDNVRLVSPSITTTNSSASYTGALVGFANMPGIHNCLVITPTLSGGNSIGVFAGGQYAGNIRYTYFTGNNNYSNVGYTIGSNANTSIGHAYALTLSGGATTSNAAAFTYNSTDYYLSGTINLAAAPAGWIYAYTVNGSPIDGTSFTISADATVALSRTPDPTHFSVNDAGTEYTIHTATGWNVFCDLLADNAKGYFSGKTVVLANDITVTRMAGGSYHDFTGTFDGGGHTLTFSHTATDNYCAPFRYVQGATAETPAAIRNLNVVSTVTAADYRHPAGLIALQSGYVSVTGCNVEAHISSTIGAVNTSDLYPAALVSQSNNTGVLTVSGCTTSGQIATDGKYAAGLIGIVQNTATIDNCRVSVTIQSSTSGDGTHGGLVASQASKTTITITGCLFDGSLLGSATSSCGGFIGWRAATATIYNSLFAPAEVTVQNAGSATFARNTVDTYNCYYTRLLNDGTNHVPELADGTVSPAKWHNGKATRTVAAGTDVTIDGIALTGTATQYTVSGITAYSGGGLQLGETLYYGSGDQLSLTLSNSATAAPQGYQYTYTASAGTLSGTTLTMPDENVTISAALRSTRQPVTVAYINADGTTDEASAIALDGHEAVDEDGDVCLDEGTYYVGNDITYTNRIYLYGDVTLILADGKTMTLNDDTPGILNDSRNLIIYGQSLDDDAGTLSYNGTADGITVNNYEQHSGNVSITTIGSTIDSWVWGIDANDVTLRGGTLAVTADGTNAIAIMGGTHSILGGQLTATATGTDATGIYASASSGTVLTLGWTRPDDRITASSISTTDGGTVAVATGKALTDGSGNIYTGTLSASGLSGFTAETTLQPCLALADAADNNAAITAHAGQTLAVALSGRTLYKDGSWNTLCLPFNVDLTATDGPLYGATARTVTAASISGSTLNLTFGDEVNTLEAGTPYIIKWEKAADYVDDDAHNIVTPVFSGVTIDATERNYDNGESGDERVRFCGTYKSTAFDAENKSILLMGGENTLYYPATGAGIGSFRAYFKIGDEGVLLVRRLTSFSIDFGEGDNATTGIKSIDNGKLTIDNSSDGWYSLDGRKLDGKPTQHGIYINNGKKIVIK